MPSSTRSLDKGASKKKPAPSSKKTSTSTSEKAPKNRAFQEDSPIRKVSEKKSPVQTSQEKVLLSPKTKKLLSEAIKRKKTLEYTNPTTGFQAFCEAEVKIIPKDATKGFIPMVLNDAQKIIVQKIEEQRAKTGRVRVIILKARQQGISTLITSRVFWKSKFNPNTSSVIMAHDGPTSEALFKMSKNLIDNLSEEFKPPLDKSAAREISFEDNKSSYRLFTAGAPESGRGVTPTMAHLSEVAFWPYDQKILAGLFQGISSSPNTEIILESTANGIGNEFHRLWMEAEDGKSDYIGIFIPWFLTKEYARETPEGFQLTPEEEILQEKFSLTPEQIYWRRLKILESGETTFKQEYPSTPQEAFIMSGSSVFDKEKLALYIPQPIIHTMAYDPERQTFVDDRSGSLKVYLHHDHSTPFIIGADVSLGVGKDYSTAIVLSKDKKIYAVYRDNLVDPSLFGDVLFYLSRLYNNALLCPETNSMGMATLSRLQQMKHQNLYRPTKNANVQASPDAQPGFKTTQTTKPAIIGNLKRAIENEELWIPSTILISELQSYIMKDNGGTEAAANSTDDLVMGLAIALEAHRIHGDRLTVDRVNYTQIASSYQEDNTTWF